MTSTLLQNEQNVAKIRHCFQKHSLDGVMISGNEVKKFFETIGLCNEMFLEDLYYFYPSIQKDPQNQISFEDCLTLIDYIISKPQKKVNSIVESFKVFDKNGNGQVNLSDLLMVLKRHLGPKEYEMYSSMVTSSNGPTINYLELLCKQNFRSN